MEDWITATWQQERQAFCDDPDCPCKDFGFDPLNLGPQNENKIIEAAMTERYDMLPWRYGD